MEKYSSLAHKNRIALLGLGVGGILYTITFASEYGVEKRPLWYLLIGLLLAWLPVVVASIGWRKDRETDLVKHTIAVGFAIVYTYNIFLTLNGASYVYVFPMILMVCVFNDLKYMLKIMFGVVLENLIVTIGGLVTKSAFGYVTDANSAMQLMAVLAMAVASVVVMKALEEDAKERVDEMEEEKAHTEKALHHVTSLTERMTKSIDEINQATEHLTTSAESTSLAMNEVAGGAEHTSEAVEKQMNQTEKIQQRIESINTEATTVAENMTETIEVLKTGKQDMDILVGKVDDSVALGVDITSKLENLDEYIKNMHTIVGIIGEITSQTSLLALNASIEAARAGEAGKGFAVVAGEITNMASQTQSATTNITDLINGVSNAVNEVVTTVRTMIEGINAQKESAENTVASFRKIESNTLAISDSVESLSTGVQELEVANRQIADYIEKISAISQQLSARSNETLDAQQANTSYITKISDMVSELAEMAGEEA